MLSQSDRKVLMEISANFALVNEAGQNVLGNNYSHILELSNGCFALEKNSWWNFASPEGILIPDLSLPGNTDSVSPSEEFFKDSLRGHVCVLRNNKWHFITPSGTLSAEHYDEVNVRRGSKESISVRSGNFWALANNFGKLLTPAAYDSFEHFQSNETNLLIAKRNGKYGYLHKNIPVCEFSFDKVEHFQYFIHLGKDKLVAKVYSQDKQGLIVFCENSSPKCKLLIPCNFEKIILENWGIIVKSGLYYGLYGLNGCKILEPVFTRISPIKGTDFLTVCFGNNCGIYSIFGEKLVPPAYDNILHISTNNNIAILRKENYCILYEFCSCKREISRTLLDEFTDEKIIELLISAVRNLTNPTYFHK